MKGILLLHLSMWAGTLVADGAGLERGGGEIRAPAHEVAGGLSEIKNRCLVNGLALHDGALWSSGPCSECRCNRGVTSCLPSCTTTAQRDKRLTQSSREKDLWEAEDDLRLKKRSNVRRITGKKAVEIKYKRQRMVPVPEKEVTSTTGRTKAPDGLRKVMVTTVEVKRPKLALPKTTPARAGLTLSNVRKIPNERIHFSFEDDDDDFEDDDDFHATVLAAGPLSAVRPISHPTIRSATHPAKKSNFMESLPVGCLLSESVIACGNSGMTHLPVINDLGVKTLYFAENKIRKIPPRGLDGVPNLEWLDLSKNKLDDSSFSPDLFRNLTKLKRLNLDGNNLTKIPPLPSSLEELKINDNKISAITPHSFKGLSKLLTLELEDNRLHDGNVSPLAFQPLRKLIYLRLEENKFRAIPSGLPASLQELHLSENRIEEVQESILNKTVHLRALDLSHNRLREDRIAAKAWINLLELEALDLSHNKLVHVPSFLPTALLQLSLHHNQIECIPGYVFGHMQPGLESLRLSHNHLTEGGIHGVSFHGLQRSLTELLLDHNQLHAVPRGLLQLKTLEMLRLDHNLIRNVPMNSICDMRVSEDSALISVHLENNLINRRLIPPTAFSCIRSYNSVQLWPQAQEDKE